MADGQGRYRGPAGIGRRVLHHDRFGHGVWAVLTAPELYAWAAVGVAATARQQSAFRAGSLAASLPTMTIAEPVVASTLGVLVLGETLRPGDRGWVLLIAAVVAMVVATVALARSEAAAGAPTGAAVTARDSG